MKKNIIVFVLLFAALLFVGCTKKEEAKDTDSTAQVEEGDSVIDNIRDALARRQKMECTYKVKDTGNGEMVTKSYFEGERYKTEYSFQGISYASIFDGDTMYTWDKNTKKGTKMDIDCLEEFDTAVESGDVESEDYEEYQSSEDMLDDAVDVSCRPVLSIDFSVPTDVEFVDQCEMIRQQMEALEDVQEQLPDLEDFDIPEF